MSIIGKDILFPPKLRWNSDQETLVLDTVEEFKRALARVPKLEGRITKAKLQALCEAHSVILNLPAKLHTIKRTRNEQ